jgi:hypothetical protein
MRRRGTQRTNSSAAAHPQRGVAILFSRTLAATPPVTSYPHVAYWPFSDLPPCPLSRLLLGVKQTRFPQFEVFRV